MSVRKIVVVVCIFLMVCASAFGATMGEKNALASAKNYLSIMGFSYTGLIEQLMEFDGFTRQQAEYGVKQNGYE